MSLIRNDRVGFDYEIIEKLEAGLVLVGTEVKSLRGGHGSLRGAHVLVRGGEAYLVGATIPPWQAKNAPKTYVSERNRKLLLNAKELAKLVSAEGTEGLTVVPISVYNSKQKLKLEIAIVRGKKMYDKRQTIKARDEKRHMDRVLKRM